MKPNGAILYQGPSLIDGKPIVAIATGIRGTSANAKTGAMVQTWILRADVSPVDAVKSGDDASICGDCKHRGNFKTRTCYVTVVQAPRSVWAAYQRGRYPAMSPDTVATLTAGRSVRLGSYGDPAAVPSTVWTALLATARNHTGYTHAWKSDRVGADYRPFLMASVDSTAEYHAAIASGWRTFRVRAEWEPLEPREVVCPASAEANYRTTCERCGLCAGADKVAKSVAIIAHGTGARNFVSLASLKGGK